MEKKPETWTAPKLERVSVVKLTQTPDGGIIDLGTSNGSCSGAACSH